MKEILLTEKEMVFFVLLYSHDNTNRNNMKEYVLLYARLSLQVAYC